MTKNDDRTAHPGIRRTARKISVALEEMGLPYKVFPVNISKGEQMGAGVFWRSAPNQQDPRDRRS